MAGTTAAPSTAVTRRTTDPLRNFKFQVDITYPGASSALSDLLTRGKAGMAFTNVAGLNMNTEMVPYREGGWNTNFHKLPGQTDFGPLTLIQGVMWGRAGMWELAKTMFAVQWGDGSLDATTDFRYSMVIRVLEHPVTHKPGAGSSDSTDGARLAFKVQNCWTGSVAFNDLNAAGNEVFISQMTVHHEGFDVIWGANAANA